MARRTLILLACMGATYCLFSVITAESSSASNVRQQRPVVVGDLKEQLESHLRPRTPAEFAFIGRVVSMVQQRRLPLRTVKVTFNWARRKRPYPFPYFQRALIIQAAKVGIRVR